MKSLQVVIRVFICLTLLTGVLYPLVITVLAQTVMKYQADGSFITYQNRLVGSYLIAQNFEKESYFWSRPSFINYNALTSGGSNLGPTSQLLKETVDQRSTLFAKAHGLEKQEVPSEMVYASGSGLDPHITPQTAHLQIARILKARQLDPQVHQPQVQSLISQLTEKRYAGFLGEECVNVLLLNLALDSAFSKAEK